MFTLKGKGILISRYKIQISSRFEHEGRPSEDKIALSSSRENLVNIEIKNRMTLRTRGGTGLSVRRRTRTQTKTLHIVLAHF